jgi:predicted flap endonuclease-1-like 5' DNA nuclease
MAKLVDIEGIGETYAAKLQDIGLTTQEKLLEAGATPRGRKDIATRSGISEKLILKWINRADLARVKGIGEEYADLLEAAGVDTVPDLARRNPANLHAKLAEINDQKNLVRSIPGESQVTSWVEYAKTLPRAINY